jgi:hypothetical protein
MISWELRNCPQFRSQNWPLLVVVAELAGVSPRRCNLGGGEENDGIAKTVADDEAVSWLGGGECGDAGKRFGSVG